MWRKLFLYCCFLSIVLLSGALLIRSQPTENENYNYKTLAHMKRLGFMFHKYHERKGHFPPAFSVDPKGRKLHSWRTLLLEVEMPELFSQIKRDEPWDSDHNQKLGSKIPYFYVPPQGIPEKLKNKFYTNYFVFVDKRSAFTGTQPVSLKTIQSDKSSTFLAIEAPGYFVHWMEPTDFDKDSFSMYFEKTWGKNAEKSSYRPGLCMIDGTVDYNRGFSLSEFFDKFSICKVEKNECDQP